MTQYLVTDKGNIVAMINGVETYINPITGASNPVEKPCFEHIKMYGGVRKTTASSAAEIFAEIEAENSRKAAAHQEWLSEMYAPAKGWYVVTIDVVVSKIRGNDGTKTYSFKVLAESQANAYDKAVALAMTPGGIKDRNVSFVYHVKDSMKAALIEFVGVWTDETEEIYGPEA